MQTFLPESARILDYRRLGKQRVEAIRAIEGIVAKRGWTNHPAMWLKYPDALALYGRVMCTEWIRRFDQRLPPAWLKKRRTARSIELPWWLGDSIVRNSYAKTRLSTATSSTISTHARHRLNTTGPLRMRRLPTSANQANAPARLAHLQPAVRSS